MIQKKSIIPIALGAGVALGILLIGALHFIGFEKGVNIFVIIIFFVAAGWVINALSKKICGYEIFNPHLSWTSIGYKLIMYVTALIVVTLYATVLGIPNWSIKKPPLSSLDPECIGVLHEYYILGFGVEHTYEGEIAENMPVKVVLSCDHTTFTISGSINQIITSSDIKENPDDEALELADLMLGSEVVKIDSDYNKDGYNDLSSIINNGSEVDSTAVFLYNPQQNKFIYSKELSTGL